MFRHYWHAFSLSSSALRRCLVPDHSVNKRTSCSPGRACKQRPDARLLPTLKKWSPTHRVFHMTCDMETRCCSTNSIHRLFRDPLPARRSLEHVRFLKTLKKKSKIGYNRRTTSDEIAYTLLNQDKWLSKWSLYKGDAFYGLDWYLGPIWLVRYVGKRIPTYAVQYPKENEDINNAVLKARYLVMGV
jgi:hypothetical protein